MGCSARAQRRVLFGTQRGFWCGILAQLRPWEPSLWASKWEAGGAGERAGEAIVGEHRVGCLGQETEGCEGTEEPSSSARRPRGPGQPEPRRQDGCLGPRLSSVGRPASPYAVDDSRFTGFRPACAVWGLGQTASKPLPSLPDFSWLLGFPCPLLTAWPWLRPPQRCALAASADPEPDP